MKIWDLREIQKMVILVHNNFYTNHMFLAFTLSKSFIFDNFLNYWQESSVLADDGNEVEDRVFSMSDPIRNSEGQNGHGSHFLTFGLTGPQARLDFQNLGIRSPGPSIKI